MKTSTLSLLLLVFCLSGCDVTSNSPEDIISSPTASLTQTDLFESTSNGITSNGAGINVPGCNNDDGLTDIIGPDAVAPFSEEDLIFNIPIVSSNCVLGAGPTEHYTVLARLPDGIAPPKKPVVWNFENTGLPCYASTETFNFTTDWAQRITPSGNVILVCHFKATE